MRKSNKQGFTIVELVIVIAVIAILAAVLIPTFSSLISASKRSNDLSSVTNMNKLLLYSATHPESSTDFATAQKCIVNGGFDIPFKPALSNDKLYWLPVENKVVLYDTKTSAVVFPQDYADRAKDDTWVDISAPAPTPEPTATPTAEPTPTQSAEATVSPTPTATPTATPTPEIPETDHTLLKGSDFNKALKQLAGSTQITKIVFGKVSEHADKVSDKPINISTDNALNAYLNGSEIYILSNKKIIAPEDASDMFSGMSSLGSIAFENFDTSAVKKTDSMFDGCSSLGTLDLSMFNISNVTSTRSMFNGCSSIKSITVKTGTNNWNTSNVDAFNSVNMFYGCSHLRNYEKNNATYIPFISDIISAFVPGTTHDITYANTGTDGYLTEK